MNNDQGVFVRKLFGILALVAASNAVAQTAAWNISEIKGKDNSVVGYIYHSSAVGTQVKDKTEKVVSGLRLVCSTKGWTAMGDADPIIAIYWNGMFGNTNQKIDVKVDGRPVTLTTHWDQDNQIVFRKISESAELIHAMKTGRNVTFSWTGTDTARRTTTISLRDFNQKFGEFNNSCKTQ
jgi:hypothetical protein